MTPAAPRIDQRILAAIAELDRRDVPIAETNRRVGALAAELGLARPSYEQVRAVVHAARNGRRVYGWRDAYLDTAFRVRSPEAAFLALVEREPRRESK
ncbi:MAG TPA: hypothetical protein VF044_09545 [Actinomycetota bacterium]